MEVLNGEEEKKNKPYENFDQYLNSPVPETGKIINHRYVNGVIEYYFCFPDPSMNKWATANTEDQHANMLVLTYWRFMKNFELCKIPNISQSIHFNGLVSTRAGYIYGVTDENSKYLISSTNLGNRYSSELIDYLENNARI